MRLTPGLPAYHRRRTRVVMVGDVGIGGDNPIRVQSMTTPATTDTEATVGQIARLVEAGCEIVRVTVPTSADAENLPEIRRGLKSRGIRVPLVADIHFTPAAAMKSVEHVEKVRVNPGNFADKKKFAVREYSDAEYAEELGRIEKVLAPLAKRCHELGVAMRIGTNHGSLSDRIMNRYGDSPEGMVESALEFVRICEGHGFRDIVLSMKASNPTVVLDTYRMLVRRMDLEGMDYPLHLGVTEAGDGVDGRIKSAIGIGTLLEEGIGDTVRVSLTEDPVAEIPVAYALVAPYNANLALGGTISGSYRHIGLRLQEPPVHHARKSEPLRVGPRMLGGDGPILVEVPLSGSLSDPGDLRREIDAQAGVRVPEETRAEIVSVGAPSARDVPELAKLRASLELVAPHVALSARVPLGVVSALDDDGLAALFEAAHRVHVALPGPMEPRTSDTLDRMLAMSRSSRAALLLEAGSSRAYVKDAVDLGVEAARRSSEAGGRLALTADPALDVAPLLTLRKLVRELEKRALTPPIVLLDRPGRRGVDPLLGPAAHLGGLLCEGIGDAVHVETSSAEESRRLAFNILQGARVRITKTEFISCPSCGRTLFDLETTTARIKERTSHLKGLKIAVMGCVVNGPGEMADADFGYVGWGDDKIALFVGREMVEKDIPTDRAADRLVELIRLHGKWVDPPVPAGGAA